MSKVDWSKAPKRAVCYANGMFWEEDENTGKMRRFIDAEISVYHGADMLEISTYKDFETRSLDWPNDDRIDAIAQNGNTGEHYNRNADEAFGVELSVYAQAKHDSDKPRYDLLPPVAIDLMAQVMTFGAKKYKPEGWRTVPDALQRYQAALLRHSFAMLRGEVLDQESGLPHAAHAMCCAAFIAELQELSK